MFKIEVRIEARIEVINMADGYKIVKALNNNVVISEKNGKLYVLMGKGIGFGKKKGDPIDEKGIEQKYASIKEEDRENYKRLIQDVDSKIIAVSEEIISLARNTLNEDLNSHIHLGLTDHINFAIVRLKEGMDIVNPFLFEIQTMYPKEYSIGERAVELIKKRLGHTLPESEIGFIALHVHSARVNQSVGKSLKNTMVVKETVEFIQGEIGVRITENSLDYARLMSHLKYCLYRIEKGKTLNNVLLESVKKQLREDFNIAKRVCVFLSEKLEKDIPEDEVGYIAIHINRLRNSLDDR